MGGAGGAGVANSGTIATLTNTGTISGGTGGAATVAHGRGGAGGAGVSNSDAIVALTGSGTIGGGNGGLGAFRGRAGRRGRVERRDDRDAVQQRKDFGRERRRRSVGHRRRRRRGLSNSGTIFALTNSGLIKGGKDGTGPKGDGAQGDAIDSGGGHASIGSITNTGQIVGNVVIHNQVSITVTGGSGTTFGRWTGGAITIGAGSLNFASGNTALGDDISVDGGSGIVANMGALRLAAPRPSPGISRRVLLARSTWTLRAISRDSTGRLRSASSRRSPAASRST